jgi:small GTP-binding protein
MTELSQIVQKLITNVKIIPSRIDSESGAPTDFVLKWLVLGDAGVGKTTCLEVALGCGTFNATSSPTIGIEFFTARGIVEYSQQGQSMDYRLQVFDCAGQHRFRSIVKSYYRHAHIITILFDITRSETFEGVRDWHKHIVDELGHTGYICMLIATHCDYDLERCVHLEEGVALAKELGCLGYYEISSKDGNVLPAFESCLLEAHHSVMNGKLKLIPPTNNKKSFKLNNTIVEPDNDEAQSGCVTCFVM